MALEISGVDTFYGESQILYDVTMTAGHSTATALLGRNGAGKTTLIRSIVGFTPPKTGTIRWAGQSIERTPAHRIARAGLGLVPQGRRVFKSLTVAENLRLAGSAREAHRERRFDEDSVYELFPRLKERRRNYGDQLSGGEQQMLAIGRALMTSPDFILMDEPSEGLAPIIVDGLGDTIVRLREMGLGILLVEQNLPLTLACTTDAYILSKGQVVWKGPVKEIAENAELRREYLAV